ncbi:hypothetical protein C9E81_00020 [Paracoccus alkanivorans]|uniref:Class I SAM-dependent methyltransferase n=2 Tax=Paracoccus alkanivorans TaxID=2116655 RepID=A0A3M0MJE9_9RHOB|nr:hypothetical protein C9E81_00020 [Paracoccus alkanivorans]
MQTGVRAVEADLSGPFWTEKVVKATNSMTAAPPVAMVSTTALHWLSPGDLAEFYGAAGELLQPSGIVMNGDHMRFDDRWPTLSTIARNMRQRVEREAVEKGEDDWAMWWERAARISGLAHLKAERDAFLASRAAKRDQRRGLPGGFSRRIPASRRVYRGRHRLADIGQLRHIRQAALFAGFPPISIIAFMQRQPDLDDRPQAERWTTCHSP